MNLLRKKKASSSSKADVSSPNHDNKSKSSTATTPDGPSAPAAKSASVCIDRGVSAASLTSKGGSGKKILIHKQSPGATSSCTSTAAASQVSSPTRRPSKPLTTGLARANTEFDINSIPTLGTGRAIPIYQGFLNKKQDGSMKRDWKRRYVTLMPLQIVYYSSLQDYSEGVNGKSMDLRCCTVKPRESTHQRLGSASPTQSVSIRESTGGSRSLCTVSVSCGVISSEAGSKPACRSPSSSSYQDRSSPQSPTTSHHSVEPTNSLGTSSTGIGRNCSFNLRSVTKSDADVKADEHLIPPNAPTRSDVEKDHTRLARSHPTTSSVELDSEIISSPSPKPGMRSRMNSFSRDLPRVRKRSNTVSSMSPAPARMAKPKVRDDLCPETYDFKIVSLTGKMWAFETTSKEDYDAWISAIKLQIQAALENSLSDKKLQTDDGVVERIQQVDGNKVCADCCQTDPEWASLNFGSLICIQCSAVHRNLGAHVSRVRSLSLDEWSPELVEVMVALGNGTLLSVYECHLDHYFDHRLKVDASREEREAFIRQKYVLKDFLAELPSQFAVKTLTDCLKEAVLSNDIKLAFHVLAHCTKLDLCKQLHDGGDTILHKAAEADAIVLTQLLIWNGADVNVSNSEGKTPLSVSGDRCKAILLSNGAK